MPDSISLQMARRQLAVLTDPDEYDQDQADVIEAVAALRRLLGDTSDFARAPCLLITLGNVALSGEQSIDGHTTDLSRMLVANQTDPAENGIYITSPDAWTRAADFADWSEIAGSFMAVESGDSYPNTAWQCTAAPTGVVGTDPITFVQLSGAGDVAIEAATRAAADSALEDEISTLSSLLSAESGARNTGDANTLAAAEAYTDLHAGGGVAAHPFVGVNALATGNNSGGLIIVPFVAAAGPDDPESRWTAGVGNYYYTVPEDGFYEVACGIETDPSDGNSFLADEVMELYVYSGAGNVGLIARYQSEVSGVRPVFMSGKKTIRCAAGALLRAKWYNGSAGAHQLVGSSYNFISVRRVG